MSEPIARRDGEHIALPGIATVHSHAFQRALRGRTQRRDTGSGNFWSWRGLMYELASKLDPDTIFAISRHAFAELAASGVTAVGEFHYVHHQPNGVPYADRTVLSEAVVAAALDAGLRVTLLRALYHRGGVGRDAEGAQKRFSDADVGDALADVDALRAKYKDTPLVRVAVAPHSIRAVPRRWIVETAEYAARNALPFHMHVAEQRREIDECVEEHGMRPVQMLFDDNVLSDRFVAIHGTHLLADEAAALGEAKAFVGICRSTERDLGDGLPDVAALVNAGARLCTGIDSHAVTDPFEEARAMELDERARTEKRHAALEATDMLRALTTNAYAAIGWAGSEKADRVLLRGDDPALCDADDNLLEDAVLFGAGPRAVDEVWVGDQCIVEGGHHLREVEFREGYLEALRTLGLR